MSLPKRALGAVAALCLLGFGGAAFAADCGTLKPTTTYDAEAQVAQLGAICKALVGEPLRLAQSATIAAGAASPTLTVTAGGSYLVPITATSWNSTGSLTLQVLGPDGATWLNTYPSATTFTANGTGAVVIGAGSQMRLYNGSGVSVVGVNAWVN